MVADAFTPLGLRGIETRNRIMMSPMCQYSCEGKDGLATDWHLVHLGSRAVGGAGIVMAEATAVEPRGRISPRDLGIWSREHADALAPVAQFVRGQGAVPGIQLAHAGRKGSETRPWEGREALFPDGEGWEVISPGAEPRPGEAPPTRKMTHGDIETVIAAFADAATRARDAGFEVVELHAAHGYLLHEFLSPVVNTREDEYGGNFENRTRLLREVTAAVREEWPEDRPVFVRISATDWLEDRPSWTVDQSVRLADRLAGLGVDLIDVSSGGIHPDQNIFDIGPNYQVPYGERIREETDADIAVATVGGITTPQQVDAIVRNDRADVAVLGRQHLRDPYFSLHAAGELDALDRADPPDQYHRVFSPN